MPGGDRTGPAGLGPMTGRGAGYCAGFAGPGYINPIPGHGSWGWGRGRGGGRGRCRWFHWHYAPGMAGWPSVNLGWPAASYVSPFSVMTRQQELDVLKGQAEYFEDVLDSLRQRIEQLEASARRPDPTQHTGSA